MSRPIALTIAGSDSSGGAGIQADLKTFTAFGVYGASVLTALTAQNTRGVQAVHVVPPEFVVAQMQSVFGDLAVGAVKTGMLANRAIVLAVADALAVRPALPLVVDPVMIATSGDPLLEPDAVTAVRDALMRRADLITPNLAEAAHLLGVSGHARSEAEMADQGRLLLALGARAVLMKGGHADSTEAVDLLVTSHGIMRFASPRIDTRHTHGTGCTLSAAIAAALAAGRPLAEAVGQAKEYLGRAIAAGRTLGVGHGRGPVDHLAQKTL
jgi:hydroxymethylpyrimidine/phosphomethylpyrimidine kinase